MSPSRRGTAPIILAAGGTGGHLFPAEALAEALLERGQRVVLVTDRRGQSFGGALGKIEVLRIHGAGVAGRSLMRRAQAMLALGLGYLEAKRILRRLSPSVCVGFGGYASLPTMMAATALRLPTVIHEQNAVLGRANRLLAPRVSLIATSFPVVDGVPAADAARVARAGNPVRPALLALRERPYPEPSLDGPLEILVLGGSQGAHVFSDIIPKALALLPQPLRARLKLSQQCRPEDIESVQAAYARDGIQAELATFFSDVPERLGRCHLAICRAGASTVSELAVAGRPAILVPYPHAIDDHQMANARAMDEIGAAWLMPQAGFTPQSLAARLESLLTLPQSLTRAAAKARAAGRPEAAARLADLVESLTPEGVGTPKDGAPGDSAPGDSAPGDSAPGDSASVTGIIASSPASKENAA